MREVKNNRVYLDGVATAEYICDDCYDSVSDLREHDDSQLCSECYDKAVVMEEVAEHLETVAKYYTTDDFKDNYAHCLIEDTQNNGAERLVENSKRWWDSVISLEDAERVIEHVTDNYEEYVRDFRFYWVGEDSVGSVSFGEQEEEFPESIDKELFVEDDYKGDFCYVSGRFYYDMSDEGTHFKVTEDDAKTILAQLDEDAQEDAKWETGK